MAKRLFMPQGSRALGLPEQRTFRDHAMLDNNGYFGNRPRVIFLTSFPHLNYGGHTVRVWCSRLGLGSNSTSTAGQIFSVIQENLRMPLQRPSHNFSTQPSSDRPARKRPVSERRIQANRKNAALSTGPKTARGKQIVSRNAIEHGILTREVVITAGDGEESLEEFHELVEQMRNCYQPVGVVEETLVQTIVSPFGGKPA